MSLEDRTVEITETNTVKIKSNGKNLRNLWDNVKCSNICIIGIPEKKQMKGHEKIFEEIIVENFPKTGKEIATQI